MARYTTEYEWTLEPIDEHGDIIDADFSETLTPLKQWGDAAALNPEATRQDLGLVRTVGNDDEGVVERTWAYGTADGLPAEFEDGHTVPQRFFKEFARNREWAMK